MNAGLISNPLTLIRRGLSVMLAKVLKQSVIDPLIVNKIRTINIKPNARSDTKRAAAPIQQSRLFDLIFIPAAAGG